MTLEKKVKGRKRHLVVDTLGLLLVVQVTPASIQDRDAAGPALRQLRREFRLVRKVWVDGGYNGPIIDAIRRETGLDIEVVKRIESGFVVLPRRWVVERTNGWLCKFRILNKEYERTLEASRADVLHAMIAIMLQRLSTPGMQRREAR